LAKMDASITAKDMELAKRTEELSSSQKEKEALTCKMAEIREALESGQRRIKALLQEKDALERDLKVREACVKMLSTNQHSGRQRLLLRECVLSSWHV